MQCKRFIVSVVYKLRQKRHYNLAKELGPRKIAVNVVAPGAIETDFGGGVVIDKPTDFTAKKHIRGRISIRLAESHISSDIIIQSADIVNERKDKFGYLTYYALKEGLAV